MNRAAAIVEIGLAEITGFTVHSDAQLRAALSLGEFDVHVIAVNRLLEQLDRLFRTQTGFHWMISLAKPVDKAFFPRLVRVGRRRRRRRIFRHLFHFLSEAERSHIRPYFLDESQTLGLRADHTDVLPAQRNLFVIRPDRVLLLVIYNNSVNSSVFLIRVMPTHTIKPPYFGCVSPA